MSTNLRKGQKRLYEYLKTRKMGDLITTETILKVTWWSLVSLETYYGKEMLEPLLARSEKDTWEVLIDGKDLTPEYMLCLSQHRGKRRKS